MVKVVDCLRFPWLFLAIARRHEEEGVKKLPSSSEPAEKPPLPPPCLPPNRHKFSKAVRLLLPLLPPATLSLATLRNCDLS